eukprot:9498504-Pyramimonas_sp.AAC.1
MPVSEVVASGQSSSSCLAGPAAMLSLVTLPESIALRRSVVVKQRIYRQQHACIPIPISELLPLR